MFGGCRYCKECILKFKSSSCFGLREAECCEALRLTQRQGSLRINASILQRSLHVKLCHLMQYVCLCRQQEPLQKGCSR